MGVILKMKMKNQFASIHLYQKVKVSQHLNIVQLHQKLNQTVMKHQSMTLNVKQVTNHFSTNQACVQNGTAEKNVTINQNVTRMKNWYHIIQTCVQNMNVKIFVKILLILPNQNVTVNITN